MKNIKLTPQEVALIIALRRVSVEDIKLVADDLEKCCCGYPEFKNEYRCALRDAYDIEVKYNV